MWYMVISLLQAPSANCVQHPSVEAEEAPEEDDDEEEEDDDEEDDEE